jgi:hypothetical protein
LKDSQVHFHWQQRNHHARFRTGVSVHSHTLHSRESLDFIGRATANTPWLSGAIRQQQHKYRALKGREVDLKRAWWTPPLSPLHAWKLEKSQIENVLGQQALVSLTDHDNIDAGLHLSVLDDTRHCPVSAEWTVPWRATFFHLGVHNLRAQEATAAMRAMAGLTANPVEAQIAPLLEFLHSMPETLIVLNHPLWDENHIGEVAHRECAASLLEAFGPYIHALELNGLRPWRENQAVAQFASSVSLPLISGGDRHGREPNACLNLTNAATFPEFVEEIRRDGWSDVLFMPQYREPFKLRILQNMCDILDPDDQHSLGWARWSDRVFYLTDEGIEKSLAELWGDRFPPVVNRFVGLMGLVRHRRVLSALRMALMEKQEFAL